MDLRVCAGEPHTAARRRGYDQIARLVTDANHLG